MDIYSLDCFLTDESFFFKMNDTLIKSEKDWEKFFDVKHSFVSVDRESMTELKSLSKGTHIFPSDDSFLSQNINFPPHAN